MCPLPPKSLGFLLLQELLWLPGSPPRLGAGASGHAWLRSFAVEGSRGDYKISH